MTQALITRPQVWAAVKALRRRRLPVNINRVHIQLGGKGSLDTVKKYLLEGNLYMATAKHSTKAPAASASGVRATRVAQQIARAIDAEVRARVKAETRVLRAKMKEMAERSAAFSAETDRISALLATERTFREDSQRQVRELSRERDEGITGLKAGALREAELRQRIDELAQESARLQRAFNSSQEQESEFRCDVARLEGKLEAAASNIAAMKVQVTEARAAVRAAEARASSEGRRTSKVIDALVGRESNAGAVQPAGEREPSPKSTRTIVLPVKNTKGPGGKHRQPRPQSNTS